MKWLAQMPVMFGDGVRFAVSAGVHVASLFPSACVLRALWDWEPPWGVFLGLAAGFATFQASLTIILVLLRLVFVRPVRPGSFTISSPEAIPWIVADAYRRMVLGSAIGWQIRDFGPQSYLFYRTLGARVDPTFLLGTGAQILDPWALSVGRHVVIGTNAVICCHAVVGDSVVVRPVKIGDGATIGVGSVLLPGTEIGAGAVVAAGALVPMDTVVPAHEVWGGVPAHRLRRVHGEAAVPVTGATDAD